MLVLYRVIGVIRPYLEKPNEIRLTMVTTKEADIVVPTFYTSALDSSLMVLSPEWQIFRLANVISTVCVISCICEIIKINPGSLKNGVTLTLVLSNLFQRSMADAFPL